MAGFAIFSMFIAKQDHLEFAGTAIRELMETLLRFTQSTIPKLSF